VTAGVGDYDAESRQNWWRRHRQRRAERDIAPDHSQAVFTPFAPFPELPDPTEWLPHVEVVTRTGRVPCDVTLSKRTYIVTPSRPVEQRDIMQITIDVVPAGATIRLSDVEHRRPLPTRRRP
jgi:hypothetical protein